MKMLRDMQRLGIGIDRRADVPVRETGAAGQLSALRGIHGKLNAFVHWLDVQARATSDPRWTGVADKLSPIVNELDEALAVVPQSEPQHPEGTITVNAVTGPNGPFALAAAAPKPAPANSLADSLGDMLALFDDEGNFRESYQDQASVAMERAQANLNEWLVARAKPAPPASRDRDDSCPCCNRMKCICKAKPTPACEAPATPYSLHCAQIRKDALEEAAQKCEEWVITFKHEPETCDPCTLGKTMAATVRALAASVPPPRS